MAVVVTDEQRANPALKGWVAAKDKENANAQPQTQQQIDYQAKANQFTAQNWGPTGTANGLTESQNLANVYNSRGGPPVVPTEYIQGVLSQAQKDTAAQGQNGLNTAPPPPKEVAATTTGNAAPASTQKSPFDMIMEMYDNAYKSQSQKLAALRDTRLAGLAGQDTLINNQAQSGLNANDVSGARNSKALQETMANRGLGASGDYISAQIGQNTAQGENANNINLDKTQRLQGLQAEKDAINNNAAAEDLALLQQTNSDRMAAQLGQYNSDRTFGLQEAGVTGQYGNNPTYQSQQDSLQNAYQNRQLTNQEQSTQFNQNLQTKQLDRANFESDRSYNLAKSTQEWTQTFQKEQYSDQKAQQLWDNTFKDKSFTQSMNDAAASRGLQWASLNQRDKEFIADQTFKEKAFTADQEQRGIGNTLNQDKLNWDKDPTNPANIPRTTPVTVDAKTSTDNYNSAVSQIQTKKGITKVDALTYLQSVRSHVTDGDYRALSDWINKNIVK